MAIKLLIQKFGAFHFWHVPDHSPSTIKPYFIGRFSAKVNGNEFVVVENGGTERYKYLCTDVTFEDVSSSGPVETFAGEQELIARLIEVGYTGIFTGQEFDILDYIGEGSNVFFTSGGGKTLINSNAVGGGSSITDYYNEWAFDNGAASPYNFTVPADLKDIDVQ